MHTFVKTVLPMIAAVAATALTATAALAQETSVEVDHEPSGMGCVNCPITILGESHLAAPLSGGAIISRCDDLFTGVIHHNGTGEGGWTGVFDVAPGCNVANCSATPGANHWALHSLGETGAAAAHMTAEICLSAVHQPAFELFCNIEVDITEEDEDEHHYEFSAAQLCAGGARRIEGNWELEGRDIELVHL